MTNSLQWLLSSSQGADPGFFSGGGASLMNGITDWCGKQILKANVKKKASSQGSCTPSTLPIDLPLCTNGDPR